MTAMTPSKSQSPPLPAPQLGGWQTIRSLLPYLWPEGDTGARVRVVVALVLISLAHWRRGAFTLGLAMGVAGTLRWVLSERSAGVLAVRGRRFDVLFYYGCGLGLVLLTVASLPVPE